MNLPNKLTLSRIILIPVLMLVYLTEFIPAKALVAGLIFVVAIFTDFLDGKIARKHNLVTDLGKFLDPIADKLLVSTSILLLAFDGTIPAPYGVITVVILVGRDLMIGALRQMSALNGTALAADNLGKIKTATTAFAIAFLFVVSFNNAYNYLSTSYTGALNLITYALLAISVVLTIVSGANYVIKNKKVFLKK